MHYCNVQSAEILYHIDLTIPVPVCVHDLNSGGETGYEKDPNASPEQL